MTDTPPPPPLMSSTRLVQDRDTEDSLQGGSERQGGAGSSRGHGGSGVSVALAFGLATMAMDICPPPKIVLGKSMKSWVCSGGVGSGGRLGGVGSGGRSGGVSSGGRSGRVSSVGAREE